MPDVAWRFLHTASDILVRHRLDLRVEGQEHVPHTGPAIIAARHFHHLFDGAIMLATLPRPTHILVGLDWVQNPAGKIMMTSLCRAASWPVVLRRDGSQSVDDTNARQELRRAIDTSLELLAAGRVLLIFPEGYPNVDPGYTPKRDEDEFLPLQPGFVRLATLAARRDMTVPIVPAGFAYERGERWQVRLRFGEPRVVRSRKEEDEVVVSMGEQLRRYSMHVG